MLKQFADRQLNVDPKVLEFLALNIDRSLAAAAAAVEAVDRVALATGRKISRQLVIEALARQIRPISGGLIGFGRNASDTVPGVAS